MWYIPNLTLHIVSWLHNLSTNVCIARCTWTKKILNPYLPSPPIKKKIKPLKPKTNLYLNSLKQFFCYMNLCIPWTYVFLELFQTALKQFITKHSVHLHVSTFVTCNYMCIDCLNVLFHICEFSMIFVLPNSCACVVTLFHFLEE